MAVHRCVLNCLSEKLDKIYKKLPKIEPFFNIVVEVGSFRESLNT